MTRKGAKIEEENTGSPRLPDSSSGIIRQSTIVQTPSKNTQNLQRKDLMRIEGSSREDTTIEKRWNLCMERVGGWWEMKKEEVAEAKELEKKKR